MSLVVWFQSSVYSFPERGPKVPDAPQMGQPANRVAHSTQQISCPHGRHKLSIGRAKHKMHNGTSVSLAAAPTSAAVDEDETVRPFDDDVDER